jgi:hypothetical protein
VNAAPAVGQQLCFALAPFVGMVISVVVAPLTTTRRIGGLPSHKLLTAEPLGFVRRLRECWLGCYISSRFGDGAVLFSSPRFMIDNSVDITKVFLHGITRIRRRSAKNFKNISSVSMQPSAWNGDPMLGRSLRGHLQSKRRS